VSFSVPAGTAAGTYTANIKANPPGGTVGAGPGTPVALIVQGTVGITITTSPAGKQVIVDGTTYTAPQTFNWVPGDTHTLDAPSPQSGGAGVQFAWTNWSQGGSQNQTITVPSSTTTYTANFTTQYQLTLAITPSVPNGLSNISGGTNGTFYNAGTVLTLSATTPVPDGAGKRWSFTNWTGDVTSPPNTSNPVSVTMSAPRSVTANYVAQYQLTLAITPGVPNGLSNISGGTNGTFYNAGTVLTLSATTPVPAPTPGVGYIFKNWTGNVPYSPNASNPVLITMSQARSIVANYTTLVLAWNAGNTFAAQYSDPTLLAATLTADGNPIASTTINFSVGTNSGTAATDGSGIATDMTLLTQAAGSSYTATASCSAATCGVLLSITHQFTISKENALIQYTGVDTVAQVGATMTLRATVWDSGASGYTGANPESGPSATIGNIIKMWIAFDIYLAASCGTGTPTTKYAPVTDIGTLGDGIGTATQTFTSSTETSYCVIARLVADAAGGANQFYVADNTQGVGIAFYTNTGQFVTAGGWITDPNGGHGNFGLNARNNKNGQPQGQMVYVYRGLYNGVMADYVIKGTALSNFGIATTAGAYPMSATLQGKCTIQVNRASDGVQLYSDGNGTFSATATDSGQSSGIGSDTYSLIVYDKNAAQYKYVPATSLQGGNVVVHIK
jgi:hypothetical protein